MMAVGVVVRGMTACLTVAADVVVVTLLLVAVAVDGVALSLPRSFLQYFVLSIRAREFFFHPFWRFTIRHSVFGSSKWVSCVAVDEEDVAAGGTRKE